MPKNTQSTKTSSSSSYGQIHPESNEYIRRFADFEPQVDPTIQYRAAASRNRLNSSMNNPLGGFMSPQIADARRNAGNREIDEQAAMSSRAGQFDVNQQRMGQLGSLASMMSPRIVQTGSTGNSNTETGKNMFGNILDLGMGAASLAMY